MNRATNKELLKTLSKRLSTTSDPISRRALFEAHYLHRIVEAVLTGDIRSLPESTSHRKWA